MMSALEAILRRPRTVLTMMAVMVFAGVFTYITIAKEADPDIQVPVLYISIPLQGISPEDAERLLVKPMEEELRGLEGLKELTSIASQGHAAIITEFETDIDPNVASQKVREKVDIAKAELPSDAEEPTVNEVNLSLFPTIIVALSGEVPERTLFRHARTLQDELEAIPSVLEARLSGQREELLEVIIDDKRLESYNLSQAELVSRVTQNNRLVAAGALDTGTGRFNVKVPGLFENVRDIYSLPVKVSGDRVVTLSDVAEVRRTFEDPTRYARFNGQPAIAVEVIKRIGSNIVDNNQQVRDVVARVSKDWPKSVSVDFALDESTTIFEVLGSLQSAIMTAIALVMIIVVAALGMRSALLVGLAIPTSFMVGFLLMNLLGMTVNMMLMFGMVLTVGMLVDGAIVVVEYADRKMAEGQDRREAYILAAKRMFWPIASSTGTTLAAFLPMLFWPGVPGKFMSYLPITVIIVLAAALITAMIFLPVLGSLFGKTEQQDTDAFRKLAGTEGGDIGALGGFTGIYVRLLTRLIRHPAKVTLVAVLVMAGSVYAFTKLNAGVTFFVDTEPKQALVMVRARGNLGPTDKLALAKEVETIVLGFDGVRSVFTTAGSQGGGGPDIGSGAGLDVPKDLIAQLTVELKPFEERRKGALILQDIRDRTAGLAGVKIEVRKRQDGPRTGKDIRLQVRADDRDLAIAAAKRVRAHLEKNVTGLIDVEDESPLPGIEWVLNVDRAEAGRFNADITSVGALIQLVTNGVLIGNYRPDDSRDEVDIRVRLPVDQRSIGRLDRLRLQTPRGLVPVANFTSRTPQHAIDTIIRKDGKTSVFVKANTEDGVLADDKVKELDAWLKAESWPVGVQFVFRGADEEQKKSSEFLTKAMFAALFLMFIILLTQFNSFYHTVITLSTVVMSAVGVMIGMMVTGQTFSVIMTGTGVVALAGIVVNNSIVLIDTYHRLREAGLDVIASVLRTAAQRLRPVLLTTITTVFGLLPMALQVNVDFITRSVHFGSVTSIWWVQLSTAIIAGLSFATLLTLVLTPVWIAAPTVYREKYRSLRARWVASRSGRDAGADTGPALARPDKASEPKRQPLPDAAE
ncbi:MAG: efflux RND transporter permease subunit [Hyphomicrobiales bacterium]